MQIKPRWSTRWYSHRRPNRLVTPAEWSDWLLDSGSLTARLVALSGGDFYVRVSYEGWAPADRFERQALGIARAERVWVREVELCGHGQPWVFARSLIPSATLRGKQRRLKHLGTRPLGAVLFSDPGMRRGPIETAQLQLRTGTAPPAAVWARRSVFRLRGRPLLVTEAFLPALAAFQQASQPQRQQTGLA